MRFCAKYIRFTLLLVVLPLVHTGCSISKPVSQPQQDLAKASQVVDIAQDLVGTPYKYGGLTPKTGFDCSGLVYYTHRRLGYTLPRTSYAQYRATTPIKRAQLAPGDLVFFRIRRNKISHVGIYLGDDRFVHAPSSGKSVTINSLDEPYWDRRFIRGGRVF